jgi:aspartate racemase
LPDVVAEAILAKGIKSVGLLGTRSTMEKNLYRDVLARRGITVLIPDADDREVVNRVIHDELVVEQVRAESRAG